MSHPSVRFVAFTLLALMLWAAPAQAQDRKPVIREVIFAQTQKPTRRVPLGAVVQLQGKNFHSMDPDADPDDFSYVKVTISGTDCIVLDVQPELLSVLIPQFDVKPGKRKMKVKIDKRGTAEVELELVDPKEWQNAEAKQAGEMTETGGTVGPDASERIRKMFQIRRFELKRDGGANRFEVEGSAGTLPDGFTLTVFLQYEHDGRKREIDKRKVRVTSQNNQATWIAIFGPYDKQLLLGHYVVNILFELGKQGRVRARRFRASLPEDEKQIYDRIERREFTTVGTEQEIADQRKVIANEYVSRSDALATLVKSFLDAYAGACKVFFRQAGRSDYDEEQYAAYLQRMELVKDADQLKEFKKDERFSTSRGHFKDKEWLDWSTKTYMPALKKLYDEQQTFKNRYIAPPDDRADQHMEYMFSVAVNMFQEWSRATYERAKIEVPNEIRFLDLSPVPAPEVSKRFFESEQAALRKGLGVE